MLGREEFWVYLVNTLYLMLGMPIAIAGSLGLALLLSQKLRGMTVYRTLFYLPTFTYGVALMILWKKLYNPEVGPINAIIERIFRIEGPNWLTSADNLLALVPQKIAVSAQSFGLGAREALILMGIWVAIGG